MNIDEVNDFFNKKALKIKFQFSTEPLYSAMKEDNLERYKAIPLVNRSKILNLKVISKSDEFNDFYISVMNDKTTDTFIIFYYMYRKYFTNFASYKEISTKPTQKQFLKKLFLNKRTDKNETTLPKEL